MDKQCELDALTDFEIATVIKTLNDIYKSGYIPSYMLKYVCISLPKRL